MAVEPVIVRHHPRAICAEERVVLDNDNARRARLERLPDPVVIAVDIDAQKIDLADESSPRHYSVDVLARYPGLLRRHIGRAIGLLDRRDTGCAGVDHQACPSTFL